MLGAQVGSFCQRDLKLLPASPHQSCPQAGTQTCLLGKGAAADPARATEQERQPTCHRLPPACCWAGVTPEASQPNGHVQGQPLTEQRPRLLADSGAGQDLPARASPGQAGRSPPPVSSWLGDGAGPSRPGDGTGSLTPSFTDKSPTWEGQGLITTVLPELHRGAQQMVLEKEKTGRDGWRERGP